MIPCHTYNRDEAIQTIEGCLLRILLNEEEIRNGIQGLAEELCLDYRDRTVTILAVLTGSLVFLADLIRLLDFRLHVGVVQASSYRGEVMSPGDLTTNLEFLPRINGRNILLLDDILDSGNTLSRLKEDLEKQNPKEMKTAVLLRKQECQVIPFVPDYCCFEIPDVFVVGYGLDYDNRYRNLPYVAVLENKDLSQE